MEQDMTLEKRFERIEKLLGLGVRVDPAVFEESAARMRAMLQEPKYTFMDVRKAAEDAIQAACDTPSDGGDGGKGD